MRLRIRVRDWIGVGVRVRVRGNRAQRWRVQRQGGVCNKEASMLFSIKGSLFLGTIQRCGSRRTTF